MRAKFSNMSGTGLMLPNWSNAVILKLIMHALKISGLAILTFLLSAHCRQEQRFQQGVCTIGSEQLNTALNHWGNQFQSLQKESGRSDAARIIHEGRGTAVAPDALQKRICDLAVMSRPMQEAEIYQSTQNLGGRPVAIPVAVEALAIIVNHKSPLQDILHAEVQEIFGNTPEKFSDIFKRSTVRDQSWYDRKPQPYGINSATDRYRWFRHEILAGKYSDRVLELSGPADAVNRVAEDEFGLGYVRPAEAAVNKKVKILKYTRDAGNAGFIFPDRASIQSGTYGLTRYHYIYLPPANSKPAIHADTIAYLEFILSAEGQAVLKPLGLYALSPQDLNKARQRLKSFH